MRKELSQKALDELSFLKDWNQTIVDFLIKKENTEFFKELYQVITDAFDKKNLNGMRMMYNDTNEMARGLSLNKLIELNQILRDKFGFDLDEDHDKVSAKINLIVQKVIWKMMMNFVCFPAEWMKYMQMIVKKKKLKP